MVESTLVAFMATWFTQTSLFVLLNIVIATILFISAIADNQPQNDAVSAAPSLFSRATSFNFSRFYHPDSPAPADGHVMTEKEMTPDEDSPAAPSLLSRVVSFNFGRAEGEGKKGNEVLEARADGHVMTEKDKKSDEDSPAAPSLLSRVVSFKFCRAEGEGRKGNEESEARAAGHVMTEKEKKFVVDEGEIDAKADDFINKFKQQLKLQRLESLLRYRSTATATAT